MNELTDEQWYDLAQRYASKRWDCFDYPELIKAVCRDFAALASAPAAPQAEPVAMQRCKGANCNAIDGVGHSTDCIREHDLQCAGLNTAGNRQPHARYAGYRGEPCLATYSGDECQAWREGRDAAPTPQATAPAGQLSGNSGELAAQQGQATRQYYHAMPKCQAFNNTMPSCICWHDEGTGPRPEGGQGLRWRQKNHPQEGRMP